MAPGRDSICSVTSGRSVSALPSKSKIRMSRSTEHCTSRRLPSSLHTAPWQAWPSWASATWSSLPLATLEHHQLAEHAVVIRRGLHRGRAVAHHHGDDICRRATCTTCFRQGADFLRIHDLAGRGVGRWWRRALVGLAGHAAEIVDDQIAAVMGQAAAIGLARPRRNPPRGESLSPLISSLVTLASPKRNAQAVLPSGAMNTSRGSALASSLTWLAWVSGGP